MDLKLLQKFFSLKGGKMFKGVYTAIVTPFDENNKIDFKSLEKLIDFQNNSKINGLVVCGSTGEASALDDEEYIDVINFVVEKSKNKKKVIVGFGTNSTQKTLRHLEKINEIKLDAIVVIVPYYNKPTPTGIIEHFKAISANSKHKIIIYNIPSRTGVNAPPSVISELSKLKNIVGIKEASGNLEQISEIARTCDKNFSILSGDDTLTLPIMSVGGHGVISVASNIIPDEISDMCMEFEKGNIKKAIEIHQKYFQFIKSMFIETNPIPIKYILKKKNIIKNDSLRLPLTKILPENAKKIDKIMQEIL
jgi:4-hydroxy-tetrahydrodipicolinate synthase